MPEAYIVAALRTAGAKREGALSGWHPVDLGARILDALLEKAGCPPEVVDDVIFGCAFQGGEQSNNVARNAVLASVLPDSVPACTVDRQCGSSQQALHFAAQAVMSGTADVVIAGGIESMTRVPMFSPSRLARDAGMGFYFSPGLADRFPGTSEWNQFSGAEALGRKYSLTRRETDAFAYRSHQRAAEASQAGRFLDEIVPVEAKGRDGKARGFMHTSDEGIRFNVSLEAIAGVQPISPGGICTAASSSQICDGASAVLVVSGRALDTFGLKPRARVHFLGVVGTDPVTMLEGPIPATELALKKTRLSLSDIDLFEINEAFATVPLAWLKATGADEDRLNVHGGAIALGHPLGASGTKLTATLINALEQRKARYGLLSMCEGGGMANVTIFERV